MRYIVSLGSNIGNAYNLFIDVQQTLSSLGFQIKSVSSLYHSPAHGFKSSLLFTNMIIIVESSTPPLLFLKTLLAIETHLGRHRLLESLGYINRIIDLDILLILNKEQSLTVNCTTTRLKLTVPHKELCNRLFVLEPLMELLPKLEINSKPISFWVNRLK